MVVLVSLMPTLNPLKTFGGNMSVYMTRQAENIVESLRHFDMEKPSYYTRPHISLKESYYTNRKRKFFLYPFYKREIKRRGEVINIIEEIKELAKELRQRDIAIKVSLHSNVVDEQISAISFSVACSKHYGETDNHEFLEMYMRNSFYQYYMMPRKLRMIELIDQIFRYEDLLDCNRYLKKLKSTKEIFIEDIEKGGR